jgi:MFS family permease
VTTLLIGLAAVTATGAAIRSTWSPCGLSMLSTITPMAERSRNRRWGLTAAWFLLGALLGGATLGAGAALLAAGVGALDASIGTVLGIGVVLAAIAVALDLGLLGRPMPHHRRQVDEVWLDQYRSWVYGAGFGFQIGTGLMTYIMTSAVYLTVALAALTGRPAVAFGICVLFGLVRGLAIFLGLRLTDPTSLRSFHRRFEQAGPSVRYAVIGLQMAVAIVAAGATWGVVGAAVTAVAVAALAAATTVGDREPVRALGTEPSFATEG